MKMQSLCDYSKYGYPNEMEYNNLEPYYSIKGVLLGITDTQYNIVENFVGNRDDADLVLDSAIKDFKENGDSSGVKAINATYMKDEKLISAKFIYLSYKNTSCTKWKSTWEVSNIEGYAYDAGWFNEVKAECLLSTEGLHRYIPLKFRSINIGLLELVDDTLQSLENAIEIIMTDDTDLSSEESDLIDVFGISKSPDDELTIKLYNEAGEAVDCDISGIDEIKGMIASVRLLEVKAKEKTKEKI